MALTDDVVSDGGVSRPRPRVSSEDGLSSFRGGCRLLTLLRRCRRHLSLRDAPWIVWVEGVRARVGFVRDAHSHATSSAGSSLGLRRCAFLLFGFCFIKTKTRFSSIFRAFWLLSIPPASNRFCCFCRRRRRPPPRRPNRRVERWFDQTLSEALPDAAVLLRRRRRRLARSQTRVAR